ncbi:MAG: hypothetical protein KatS3mg068_2688 [Candidatus Sericytochromatia bacterium]|nr:MAG: hypothetical protein KatS3mg068_2688 [Candidatus Sericytochromatia bacterium]
MLRIEILNRPYLQDLVEIRIIDNKIRPYISSKSISYRKIKNFILEWNERYEQIYYLKNNINQKQWEKQIYQFLIEKSNTLKQILFINDPFIYDEFLQDKKVLFVLDQYTYLLPLEILTYKEKNQIYFLYENTIIYRQIYIFNKEKPFFRGKQTKRFTIVIQDNSPEEKLFFEKEQSIIKEYLIKNKKLQLEIVQNPDSETFLEKISHTNYLHYIGHSEKTGIELKDSFISYKHIIQMNLSYIKLIFLNSCESFYYDEESMGLAIAFVLAGAQNIISYRNIVENNVAIEITRLFYKYYSKENDIANILLKLRNNIQKQYGRFEPALFSLTYHGTVDLKDKNVISNKNKKILLYSSTIFLIFISWVFSNFKTLFYPFSKIQSLLNKNPITTNQNNKNKELYSTNNDLKKNYRYKIEKKQFYQIENKNLSTNNRNQELTQNKKQLENSILNDTHNISESNNLTTTESKSNSLIRENSEKVDTKNSIKEIEQWIILYRNDPEMQQLIREFWTKPHSIYNESEKKEVFTKSFKSSFANRTKKSTY